MSTLERLGSLDMTWLQIERSTDLMQVIGVLVLAIEATLAMVGLLAYSLWGDAAATFSAPI